MKDEFFFLRPAILIGSGVFVIAFILNICHEAARLRTQFQSAPTVAAQCDGTSDGTASKPKIAGRVFPAESLPGRSFELASPSAD